jgi:hypothetical protein
VRPLSHVIVGMIVIARGSGRFRFHEVDAGVPGAVWAVEPVYFAAPVGYLNRPSSPFLSD